MNVHHTAETIGGDDHKAIVFTRLLLGIRILADGRAQDRCSVTTRGLGAYEGRFCRSQFDIEAGKNQLLGELADRRQASPGADRFASRAYRHQAGSRAS